MVFVKTFCWFKAMVQRATQPVQGSEIIGSIKLRKREQGHITLSYFRVLFTNAPTPLSESLDQATGNRTNGWVGVVPLALSLSYGQ